LLPKKLNKAQKRSVSIGSTLSPVLEPDFQKKDMEGYQLLSLALPLNKTLIGVYSYLYHKLLTVLFMFPPISCFIYKATELKFLQTSSYCRSN
jgi:hypothetical protein